MSNLRVKISPDKICHPDIYKDIVRNAFSFVSYEECKKWVRENKINTGKQYQMTKKSFDIPSNPNVIYKNNGWTSWADFLGTNNYYKKGFVSYGECVKWARENNIKSSKKYKRFKNRPFNIPVCPYLVYKNSGWINWTDFLGTKIEWISYKECKKWAKKNNIKIREEYNNFKNRPSNVPACPYNCYKDSGWEGWPAFLGNCNYKNRKWISYKECQKWIIKNKIKTRKEYNNFKNRPSNVPACPDNCYKDSGWEVWAKFLKNGNDKIFVSYEECKKWARKNKIKNGREYREFKNMSSNIPASPDNCYHGSGWISWADFLGTNNYKNKEWATYKECKKWTRKNNIKIKEEYLNFKRPFNIPVSPSTVYKNSGWTNWYDFLGKKKD